MTTDPRPAETHRLICDALGLPTDTRPAELVHAVSMLRIATETLPQLRETLRLPPATTADTVSARVLYVVRRLGELLSDLQVDADADDRTVSTWLRALVGSQRLSSAVGEVVRLREWERTWSEALRRAGLPATSGRPIVLATAALQRAVTPDTDDVTQACADSVHAELVLLAQLVGIADADALTDLQLRDLIVAHARRT